MENILNLSQLIISITILIVWVFRFDNIVLEFKQYGLSNLLRNIVPTSPKRRRRMPMTLLRAVMLKLNRQH